MSEYQDYSDEAEVEESKSIAQKVFKLGFRNGDKFVAGFNMLGIRSEHVVFSRRLDSRTYFIQDYHHGVGRPSGVFRGDNKDQFEMCRAILQNLNIPLSEIAQEVVLREKTQVAQVDRLTKAIKFEDAQEGGNLVHISRQIGGLPVWSSNLLLGLSEERRIGFMELHWPAIPLMIEHEARRLAHKVQNGWKPPSLPHAIVEAKEAGIVHTPAAGFFLDIHAAIRVIYAPVDKKMGRKPILYLDRHGNNVPIRRHHPTLEATPQERMRRESKDR